MNSCNDRRNVEYCAGRKRGQEGFSSKQTTPRRQLSAAVGGLLCLYQKDRLPVEPKGYALLSGKALRPSEESVEVR